MFNVDARFSPLVFSNRKHKLEDANKWYNYYVEMCLNNKIDHNAFPSTSAFRKWQTLTIDTNTISNAYISRKISRAFENSFKNGFNGTMNTQWTI